jgi:hypothetical protein
VRVRRIGRVRPKSQSKALHGKCPVESKHGTQPRSSRALPIWYTPSDGVLNLRDELSKRRACPRTNVRQFTRRRSIAFADFTRSGSYSAIVFSNIYKNA